MANAALLPLHVICGRARLGQDFTFSQVRFDLAEAVRSHTWRAVARFSLAQVCNVRVRYRFRILTDRVAKEVSSCIRDSVSSRDGKS